MYGTPYIIDESGIVVTMGRMTNEEKINILGKHLRFIYREHAKTRARSMALEAIVRLTVPESDLSSWEAKLDEKTAEFRQKVMENHEDLDSGFAAWLDDRNPEEL